MHRAELQVGGPHVRQRLLGDVNPLSDPVRLPEVGWEYELKQKTQEVRRRALG